MVETDRETDKQQIDSTSFASILAGVKKMRDQASGSSLNHNNFEHRSTTALSEGNSATSKVKPSSNVKGEITSADGNKVRNTAPVAPITNRTNIRDPARIRASNARVPGRVSGPSEILVHKSQKGNPLLENSHMKSVSWRFDESILSDYYINPTLQFIFLSLKYFKLHPEYIWQRIKKLNKGSTITSNASDRALRILLVVVDIDSHQESLANLSDICIKNDLSLVLAWSFEEAGNYIYLSKQLDNSPAKTRDGISGVKSSDYNSSVIDSLTEIKSINKTDVSNLLANCKSIKNIVLRGSNSDGDSLLENINGLGATKLRNIKSIFSEPFIYNKKYNDEFI